MRKQHIVPVGVACIALALSWIALAESPPTTQPGAGLNLGTMAQQFDAMTPPVIDQARVNDPSYRNEIQPKFAAYYKARGDLAVQLLKADPNGPKASEYMQAAFINFRGTGNIEGATALADELLQKTTNPGLKTDCRFIKVIAAANSPDREKAFPAAADAFIATAPKDPRASQILSSEIDMAADDATKKKLTDRLVADYPDSPAAQEIKAVAARKEKIGKPFELAFNDAIGGKKIDIKDLKGKVVVIDFWATWCGPCVGEMPTMKKLYAEFKDKGVEFLGISLDQPEAQGGLKKLKDFCAANQITWPQYYQGNGWQSKFSMSWGIDSIPSMFVVDADGNLNSTEARGELEKLLPALIAKRDGK